MALGDGVRRNIRSISQEERDRLSQALLALQGTRFPGMRAGAGRGRSRYWYRQLASHVEARGHEGAEFLPWHRELCNRVEELLRDVDPDLSLHYWDWNDDPRDLFAGGDSGAGKAAHVDLRIGLAALQDGSVTVAPDSVIVHAPTFRRLRPLLERKHEQARIVYFGGTFVNGDVTLHDPLGLLVYSNVDRLFAMWQAQQGQRWRLDPARVYGEDAEGLAGVFLEPWSTELPQRPWVNPTRSQAPRTYGHPSVVAPPCYDTMPIRIVVDEVGNPEQLIRFNDVHAGKTFARAASFRVFGRGNVTLRIADGPTAPYSVITPHGAITIPHDGNLYQEARIWFGYAGGRPGETAPAGTVAIRCEETDEEFAFTLRANTVAVRSAGNVPSTGAGSPQSESAPMNAGVTWTWTWRAVSA